MGQWDSFFRKYFYLNKYLTVYVYKSLSDFFCPTPCEITKSIVRVRLKGGTEALKFCPIFCPGKKGGNKMCNYENLGKLNPNVSKYKFVQIMPAPENLYFELEDEQGIFYSLIVCMALKNNGTDLEHK